MNAPLWLLAAIEAATNSYLDMDPEGAAAFAELQGKVIGVELLGLDLRFYLLPAVARQAAFQVLGHYEGEADAWISGTPLSMLRLGLSRDEVVRKALFAGDVQLRGDIELGQCFQKLLNHLHIDWEEQLSRLTGDMVAHQLGNLARGARRWGAQAGDSLCRDVSEYLREESRVVPVEEELEDFLTAVDALRSDVDHLQARVKRLQGKTE